MVNLSPESLIAALNAAPPELVWLLLLGLCFGGILIMLRLFGEAGLYVYIVVAVLGANLQVLKPVQFSVFSDPVALGTILFASTYLCTDILAEHFGRDSARRAVLLGFAGFFLWTLLAVVTLGFAPLTPEQAGEGLSWALGIHGAMATLYTPVPALFVAGMTAYLVSQFHDIWLYRLISRLTGGRHLWLRNNASTMISALIDNIVFSVLAWVILAPEPLGWHTLIFTYILGTYTLRLIVAALDTPFLYLAGMIVRPRPPSYA
ncbi:MAG: queuosine precursor transporter [Inquilinaceae bacterium]